MPSGISKRQQLRNEKTLAELIRTVPGNDRCADCDALTPGWASWNMGIFLCMRCAAIHRKLGTHISKVKSLSMDTWSSEQVDNMKSHGNLLMNKIFNPKNIKPPVPTDIDEADSCMERFIRQKYQYRSLEDGKPKPPSREDASYTRSGEERRERQRSYDDSHRDDISPEGSPPPLPPKSGKFFGFGLRSASSTSNLRRFGNKSKGFMSPSSDQRSWSPPPRQTSGLGAPVADVTTASFEAKMAALRDMGFENDRRNEMVLRGLNENLDKSIETLVRLGEGNKSVSRAKTPVPTNNTASAGASVAPKPAASPNPFDMPTATTGNQVSQPQSTSYNPFDRPAQIQMPQSTQPLEASFQNLQVSQPLFPHSTGGYPAQTGLMPQATYQQPITPPVTSTFSQNGYVSSPQAMDSNYNPFFQPVAQPQGGIGAQSFPNPSAPQNNPFFNTTPQTQNQNPYLQPQAQQNGASAQSMIVPRQPQHANTMPAVSSASPFGTSPFGTSPFGQTPSFQTQRQQQQPQLQQQQLQQPQQFQPQTQATAPAPYNPFQQSMGLQSAGAYPNQLQPQQPQQLMPQHTARMDKSSILSLYSLNQAPSTIPSIPEQSQYQFQPGTGTSPVPPLTSSLSSTPMTQPGSTIQTPQPSANGPAMASRNPFGAATVGSGLAAQAGVSAFPPSSGLGIGMGTNGMGVPAQANGMKPSPFSGPPPVNAAFPRTHMSQPSVDINGLQSGRHSPDAFASLSARYG